MKDSRHRLCASVAIFAIAVSTGISDGLIGPTLPSLAELASSSTSDMSIIFTWRACFAIAGSLQIGHLLDRFDPSWVLAIALFFQAVFASVAPWLPHLIAISAVSGLSAFFNGGINAGTYSLMFRLHGRKASSYVQGVRMCYIGGLALAPLIAEPFIVKGVEEVRLNGTNSNETQTSTITPTSQTVDLDPFSSDTVHFAYMIVASTLIVWSLVFVIFGCFGKLKQLCPPGSKTQLNRLGKPEITLVIITMMMTFVYGGMDVGFGGLLFTYVTDYLSWSNREGVLINSVFQTVKIVVVAVTVVVAMFLHPKWLVGVDVLLLVGTSVAMLVLAETHKNIAMWVCTVTLAMGLGNLHSSNMSWLGKRVPITGKVSALFNVAFSGGIMAIPPLTGLALDNTGLKGVPIIISACSFVCVVTFILLVCINRYSSSSSKKPKEILSQTSREPIFNKESIISTVPL